MRDKYLSRMLFIVVLMRSQIIKMIHNQLLVQMSIGGIGCSVFVVSIFFIAICLHNLIQ